jgi:hypothetical protein
MLTTISWTDYLITVAIVLVIYYLFVGARYYSDDLKDLFAGKRKLKFKAAIPKERREEVFSISETSPIKSSSFEETMGDELAEVEHLIERLKAVIEDASGMKLIQQEFKQYLGMVLKEYPSVRYSPLRSSVNELIISECEKYGTITLSESEVDVLWKETVV